MFVIYAMAAIFVLLTLLLSIINGINYTMAAQDADEMTEILVSGGRFGGRPEDLPDMGERETQNGVPAQFFTEDPGNTGRRRDKFGMMRPDSPDFNASLRYFTCTFTEDGEGTVSDFNIYAVDEEEALAWAKSLLNRPSTGWTRRSYRYRVEKKKGETVVTVIDQSRELLPAYRILIISVSGELIFLIISFMVLDYASDKLFRPLEEADRKQRRFIADVEKELGVPLTVINANTEAMERENGASDYTNSIDRQVKKMTSLVKQLGGLVLYSEDSGLNANLNLSDLLSALLDASSDRFSDAGMELFTVIEPGVMLAADDTAMHKLLSELIENTIKFGRNNAVVSLSRKEGRTVLTFSNGTDLPDGAVQQAFDRFTRLPNAEGVPGAGLGLAFVKDVVRAMDGRVEAEVTGGVFTLRIRF